MIASMRRLLLTMRVRRTMENHRELHHGHRGASRVLCYPQTHLVVTQRLTGRPIRTIWGQTGAQLYSRAPQSLLLVARPLKPLNLKSSQSPKHLTHTQDKAPSQVYPRGNLHSPLLQYQHYHASTKEMELHLRRLRAHCTQLERHSSNVDELFSVNCAFSSSILSST